jgi:hypothetical protein
VGDDRGHEGREVRLDRKRHRFAVAVDEITSRTGRTIESVKRANGQIDTGIGQVDAVAETSAILGQ